MKIDKTYILKSIEDNQAEIRKYGVSRLGLFGSFARDEATSESDIDFLVEFNDGQKTYKNLCNLYFMLEEIFQKKIEVITPAGLKKKFLEMIKEDIIYVKVN